MDLIDVSKEQQVAVILLKVRRLDASAAPGFKQAVLSVIESGESRLVLDLTEVVFIDSSGLGAMVSVLKALGGRGMFALCNASVGVLSLFRLTRMDKVFPILSSRDEAVAKVVG
jgi:anti-sigma B factor antagonist